jgi:hypothetical protein
MFVNPEMFTDMSAVHITYCKLSIFAIIVTLVICKRPPSFQASGRIRLLSVKVKWNGVGAISRYNRELLVPAVTAQRRLV